MRTLRSILALVFVAAQVLAADLTTSLVAHWKFNDTATDEVNGYTLTLTGSPAYGTGKLGNGIDFESSSTQYGNRADNANLSIGNSSYAIGVWIKLESKTAAQVIASKYGGGGNAEFILYYDNGTDRFIATFYNASDSSISVSANNFGAPSTATFYYVYAELDNTGDTVKISVNNGTADSAAFGSIAPKDSTADFQVGAFNGSTFPFDGIIDSLSVWKRTLNATEQTAVYNSGTGLDYPSFSSCCDSAVTITTPVAYQVIPRSGISGNITITGTYTGSPTTIEAQWGAGPWTTIVASPSGGTYSGTLNNQFQGQGTLSVRFSNNTLISASRSFVGIGLVFTCMGQSNMGGQGNNNQTYSHASLKAALFGNDYVWKELADPYDSNVSQVDTVSSDAGAGSIAPLLATELMAYFQCPVAFIPCAKSSTDIASWQPGANHQDRTTLYGSAVYRSLQAGSSGVLWWQGESDAVASMSAATYNSNLDTVANTFWSDVGVRLMPCKLQNCTDATVTDDPSALTNINSGIGTAWGDNANVMTGPDLSGLTTDDGFHLKTDGNLAAAAALWAAKLKPAYFSAHKMAGFFGP